MLSEIQWWCAARGEPWTWAWQAYPGVWLAIAVVAVWLWSHHRRHAFQRSDRALAIGALVLLWLTLDWPIGPLGTGYLASVHALQFVSLAIVVPPMLLAAVRRGVRATWDRGGARGSRAIALVTQPVIAGSAFAIIMFVTHAPRVVDTLMRSQLGAFLLDAAWFGAGIAFWWPVVVRRPERPLFNPLLQLIYVFFGTQAHLGLAMWLLIAKFPVYATYELAPRVTRLSAMADQQATGGIMIGVVEPIVLGVMSVIFFRWSRAVEAREAASRLRAA